MGCVKRQGATLIEAVVSIVVLVLMGLVLAPMLDSVRSQMRAETSAANLMQMGQGGGMYAQDHQGRLFSYSWRAGEDYVLPTGQTRRPIDDQDAAAQQNGEILMRLTGRITGEFKIQNFSARLPHRRYLHLILIDYMGTPLGDSMFIDPADEHQLFWADNPLEYSDFPSTVPYDDYPGPGYDEDSNWLTNPVRQRWTFASSYQPVSSSWQFEAGAVRYIPVSDTPHLFTVTGGQGGEMNLHTGRFIPEVLFPSQKVWFFEEFDREIASEPYFAYNQARPEKLMFDGSVNRERTGEAQESMIPEIDLFEPWVQSYVPLDTFPIPLEGLGSDRELNQRYRWTTYGLSGFDYGPYDAPRGPRVKRVGP
ncbi:MAG: hypothetical protein ACF8K1_11845 [Phycisphaerales bacterium JB047]